MNNLRLETRDNPTAEENAHVLKHLAAFNEQQVGSGFGRELAVFARHDGEIVAGLIGFTYLNWLHIRYLWVEESLRHQGVGRRMVLAAEKEARMRGCAHAHLDTFSFQALPFYERLGYTIFGRLEDFPPGHTRYFLQKRDLPAPPPAE